MSTPTIHQQVPAIVRMAQVLGVTFTAFIAGQTASTTLLFTSIMLQAPAPLLAKQWKTLWFKSNRLVPAVSFGMSVLFAWLAWRESSKPTLSCQLYATSAILFPSIIPYQSLVMAPVGAKLLQRADALTADVGAEALAPKDETVHALVEKWASLNMGRALLLGLAAICAGWASVSQ